MKNIFYKTFFLILFLTSLGIANEKVSLQLQWKYQFQFAGYIMAKEKGFYHDAGLDVEIREWDHGIDMVEQVATMNTTFSIVRPTAIIDTKYKNDIIFLGSIFQSSPLVLLADKSSNIKTIADFKNKTLMSTGDLNDDASLISMMFSQGINKENLKIIPPSFDVKDLLNGKQT